MRYATQTMIEQASRIARTHPESDNTAVNVPNLNEPLTKSNKNNVH